MEKSKQFLQLLNASKADACELLTESVPFANVNIQGNAPESVTMYNFPFVHTWRILLHSTTCLRSAFLVNLDEHCPYGDFRISAVEHQSSSSEECSCKTGKKSSFKFYHKGLIRNGEEIEIPKSRNRENLSDYHFVYRITVNATIGIPSPYERTLVFDFGSVPNLSLKLSVKCNESELDYSDYYDMEYPELPNVEEEKEVGCFWKKKEVVPFPDTEYNSNLTDFDKVLIDNGFPSYPTPSTSSGSKGLAQTWTRQNYVDTLMEVLNVEENTRERILECMTYKGELDLCQSYYTGDTKESLKSSKISSKNAGGNSDIGDLKFARSGELFLRIPLKGKLSEDNPAGRLMCQQADKAILEVNNSIDDKVYECNICDKTQDFLYLVLPKICVDSMGLTLEKDWMGEVKFVLKKLIFAELRYGVREVGKGIEGGLDLLFPEENPHFLKRLRSQTNTDDGGSCERVNEDMNGQQRKVLDEAQRRLKENEIWPSPILITGPFGTGKTFTLAQAARSILTQSKTTRVLVCTQANSAADLYIIKYFHNWFSKTGPYSSSSAPTTSFKFPRPLRIYYVERWISSIPNNVRPYCCFDYLDGIPFLRWPKENELKKSRLVVTTLSTAKALISKVQKGWFTHILIDEAGQVSEPQTLIPFCLIGPKTKVVLAGDPLQSGAECYSQIGKKCGLGRSLLERLWNTYPSTHPARIYLSTNYRSHTTLLKFMSDNFYNEKFHSCSELPAHPKFYPLTVIATRGIERQNASSTAFFNKAEAERVVEFVQDLVKEWPKETWGPINLESIGVLTVYQDQVIVIRGLLKKKKLDRVNVERVQNVQGKEYKVVILSTVRTLHTCDPKKEDLSASKTDFGFLSHPRLLNTALTRAQTLVGVVGDAASLCSIGSCKHVWRNFVSKAADEGSLMGIEYSKVKEHFEMIERYLETGENFPQQAGFYLNPYATEFKHQIGKSLFKDVDEVFVDEELKNIPTYTACVRIPESSKEKDGCKTIQLELPKTVVDFYLGKRDKLQNQNSGKDLHAPNAGIHPSSQINSNVSPPAFVLPNNPFFSPHHPFSSTQPYYPNYLGVPQILPNGFLNPSQMRIPTPNFQQHRKQKPPIPPLSLTAPPPYYNIALPNGNINRIQAGPPLNNGAYQPVGQQNWASGVPIFAGGQTHPQQMFQPPPVPSQKPFYPHPVSHQNLITPTDIQVPQSINIVQVTQSSAPSSSQSEADLRTVSSTSISKDTSSESWSVNYH